MKKTTSLLCILCLLSAGCGTIGALNSQIDEKEKKLHDITLQLSAKAGAEFEAKQDLQVVLRVAPINAWLTEVTSRGFTVSAVGLQSHGDLFYEGGRYKAWIQPASDTRLRLTASQFHIGEAESKLEWASTITAAAQSRIYINAGGKKDHVTPKESSDSEDALGTTNALCSGTVAATRTTGSLNLGALLSESDVSYNLEINSPTSIQISAKCELGVFGDKNFPLDFSVTRQLSSGKFDLGYTKNGDIDIGPNGKYKYSLRTRDHRLAIRNDAINYQANVDVEVIPGRRK